MERKWYQFWRIDKEIHIGEWFVIYPNNSFDLSYETCGYESPYGELHIALFFFCCIITMPFKSKVCPYGDCDAPKYGIAIHNNTFWIYRGGNGNLHGGNKWWTWDLPFVTNIHIRHEVEIKDKDGSIKMVPSKILGSKKPYVHYSDNESINRYHYTYTDKYDGTKVESVFWVEEREWRKKWLTWTRLGRIVQRYIEIEFKQEVGSEKEDWKGGVVGCSYDLLPNESPIDCIKRMEIERKF